MKQKPDTRVGQTTTIDNRSISSQVRELWNNGDGMSRSEIVKVMTERLGRPIRYQHINNVITLTKLNALKKLEQEEGEEEKVNDLE